MRAGRSDPAPARPAPSRPAGPSPRRGRFLAVLLSVALGAGGAFAMLVVAVPGALASVTGEGPAAARTAGPPASEVVLPAVVTLGSSCAVDGAQDRVTVALDGVRHDLPLDGCGAITGSTTTVRLLAAADPAGPRVPRGSAHLLGTGGSDPLTDSSAEATAASPMAGRVTVTLTVVAGIAMAGLLVAASREGLRARAAGGPTTRTRTAGARPAVARPAVARPAPSRAEPPRPSDGASGRGPADDPDTTTGAEAADATAGATGVAEDGDEAADGATRSAGPNLVGSGGATRARSRARSLRAPHPARGPRGDGRLGPGVERARRGPTGRAGARRPR